MAEGTERTVVLRPCATVTGRIVDADGKPVAGGILPHLMREDAGQPAEIGLFPVPLDSGGRFRIDNLIAGAKYRLQARDRIALSIPMEPERFRPFELARGLTAESGQVIDLGTFNVATGKPVKEPEKPATENAAQAKDPAGRMPITGRIVNLEGRPVAGASVQITQITKPKGANLDAWIEAVKRGEPPWTAYKHLTDEPPIKPEERRPTATTDDQGRFRFEGIEAERRVDLAVQGPTIAYARMKLITRRTGPIAARGFPSQHGPGSRTILRGRLHLHRLARPAGGGDRPRRPDEAADGERRGP